MKVVKLGSGYHYVPRPWYKVTETGFLVKPADFYDEYHDTAKVVEVSGEVFDCMMTAFYEEKRYYQQFDRHQPLVFDEIETGEVWRTVSASAEDSCFARLNSDVMRELLSMLAPEAARMIYYRYFTEMSLKDIAEREHITVSKAWRDIHKGLAELKQLIVNSDYDFSDLL